VFYNFNVKAFTLTFDQFNASFLNANINFLQNESCRHQTFEPVFELSIL